MTDPRYEIKMNLAFTHLASIFPKMLEERWVWTMMSII